MNPDQKLVASIGLVLVLLVLWGVYKDPLKQILFTGSGSANTGAPVGALSGIGALITNPSAGSAAAEGLNIGSSAPFNAFTGLSGQTFPIKSAPKEIGPGFSF